MALFFVLLKVRVKKKHDVDSVDFVLIFLSREYEVFIGLQIQSSFSSKEGNLNLANWPSNVWLHYRPRHVYVVQSSN